MGSEKITEDDVRHVAKLARLDVTDEEVALFAGQLAAVEDPASDLGPGPRRKLRDAADYLAVAPTVVAVACDIDLGDPDLTLPLTPADPERLVELSQRWGLDSPTARLMEFAKINGQIQAETVQRVVDMVRASPAETRR